jgi:hypothetical protein
MQSVVLNGFKRVTRLWINLVSGPKCTDEVWKLGNEGQVMTLTKGSIVICFDINIPSGDGYFSATEILPLDDAANAVMEAGQTMKMQAFHEVFGHSSEETMRVTAKAVNIKVTGNLKPCEHCLVSKSRQKNVPKTSDTRSTVAGEQLMLGISSVKFARFGGSKY